VLGAELRGEKIEEELPVVLLQKLRGKNSVPAREKLNLDDVLTGKKCQVSFFLPNE
jgi:hypothetical protein